MADPLRGKLVWYMMGTNRVRRVVYPAKKGMTQPTPFDADQLAPSLRGATEDEVEVDLELLAGKPVRIRPAGQAWAAVVPPAQPQQARPREQPRNQGAKRPARRGDFHNPYNFVPASPRAVDHAELGDHEPAGHQRYHDELISGVIRVKMTLATPLLLPDAGRVREVGDDHKVFPVRLGTDGRPLVAATSIKGMLRSAYEAVTNSRLAVFAGHSDRLADRMPARDGLNLVPASVVQVGAEVRLELLPGDSGMSGAGRPCPGDPMYAAWLPRYHQQTGQIATFAVRYPGGALPEHGDEVEVWLELWERGGNHPFGYWSVRKCVRVGTPLGNQPQPGQPRGQHRPVAGVAMIPARGFVCVTNRNIDRKHDERVFFTRRADPVPHPLTPELREQWRELIANYQTIHETEIAGGLTGPPALNNSVWSRAVVARTVEGGPGERELVAGTLCYAAFQEGTVTALYPVMISRRLFPVSPHSLLSADLRPALTLAQLSPADRVFGWVSQQGQGAYRGNVRVGPVQCEREDAVESFGADGLPLAILGQPKEQQARFYVAASPAGEAQDDGLTKDAVGYQAGKGLRGRKVYPHHAGLPAGHWDNATEDRTQTAVNGHYQEYRRPQLAGQDRDNQNRSVEGWVKVGTTFAFDLHVTNLSRVELGALLWLLSLPTDHFHRLGGGKPLGFGSVGLEIDTEGTSLRYGGGWRQFYANLDAIAPPVIDQSAAVTRFQAAVAEAYGHDSPFEQVPFIAAFLRMASGFTDGLPTHYPRGQRQPNPNGLAYEWFVANDRTGANGGPRVCLADLARDGGLPLLD